MSDDSRVPTDPMWGQSVFEGLVQAVLEFITQYGFLAVFVYMVLETAFVLHFVPSEVVVPFAASQLVYDPLSFVLFVADTTAGATVGSLLAYVGFGRYGERLLERYGHVVHITERDIDRSRAVFIRYGESSVFWARMLPLLRALISIPAGLAGMDLRRFLLYSTAGAALFNTGLTYLVYTGAGSTSPLEVALGVLGTAFGPQLGYVRSHPLFVGGLGGLVVVSAAVVWRGRGWIRSNPKRARRLTLHLVRLVGVVVGGVFVLGALSSPAHVFSLVTVVWDDPLFWVRVGFSERLALLLTGVLFVLGGLVVYELGTLLELAHVRALFDWIRSWSGR